MEMEEEEVAEPSAPLSLEERVRRTEVTMKTQQLKVEALEKRNEVLESQLSAFMQKQAYVLPDAPEFQRVLAGAKNLRSLNAVEQQHVHLEVEYILQERSSKRKATMFRILGIDPPQDMREFDRTAWLQDRPLKQWELYYFVMFGEDVRARNLKRKSVSRTERLAKVVRNEEGGDAKTSEVGTSSDAPTAPTNNTNPIVAAMKSVTGNGIHLGGGSSQSLRGEEVSSDED